MKRPLQILIVEDNPDDADLVLSELRRAGFDPQGKRVETEADFLAEIKNSPDIILSDYSMPEFNGLRAVELLKESGLNIPFILISGTVGEDVAVEAMKHGATDYLLKDRTARLGSAVERALLETQERSDRKKKEQQIVIQTRALEAAANAILITDREGKILSANTAFCTLTGYTLEEVLGQNPRFLKSGVHDADFYRQLWETVRAGRVWCGELTNRRKEGTLYHEEMTITPIRASNGEITHFIAVKQDITERKRAEAELRWRTAFFEAQVNSASDGILVVDSEQKRILQNQRLIELFHVPKQIAEDNDDTELLRHVTGQMKNPEQFLARVEHLYAHPDEIGRDEIELLDGTISDRYSSPVRDEAGKYYGRIWAFRDITERKRAEAELEKTHKELLAVSRQAGMAEFATSVLHNVGNVLNSVAVASTCMYDSLKRSKSADLARVVALMQQHEADLGAFFTHNPQGKQVPGYLAKLAERLTGEQATALKELGELQKNVEHIKSIISVQQDSAKMSRSPEALKLTDLVEDALNVNSNGLRRGGIQVTKEFAEVPPIMMEKHKVLQILVNLVRNAMQACETSVEQEKRLAIRVSQEAGRVRIAVADNGSGISPEHLSRIFAHGFTTKKDGHGFGLHGAARAAKEMGGSLAVQSEGPGRGATFTLELPMKG
jgi:PAS domain S-box-containing protein